MVSHDDSAARATGLVTRPDVDTASDTLAWARDVRDRTGRDVAHTGISRDEERELLEIADRT